jgi:hypothetical protein
MVLVKRAKSKKRNSKVHQQKRRRYIGKKDFKAPSADFMGSLPLPPANEALEPL